jgi:7-carboxy-7-deazaguanine synthase
LTCSRRGCSVTLPVSEVFTSFQGEGPRAGRVCTFIRLGGCNLSCSWCDTPYTWDASRYNLREELIPTTVDDILEVVQADEVIITGGEPLIHQRSADWANLLRQLHRRGYFINVETNGTIVPCHTSRTFIHHYSISPKLENAGKHKPKQSAFVPLWPADIRYGGTSCLKFVCENAADVAAAAHYGDKLGWRRDTMWMMPLGTTAHELLKRWPEICEAAISEGVNVTQRLHVLAFGDTRGT